MWLRAFAARGGFDTEHDDARPWLYGIARNILREHWRAGKAIGLPLAGETGCDPWDGVDERLDITRQAETVMTAVRALPAIERDVLLLVAWEQLTVAEAAKVLGIPPGTARSRLHRARAALRRMLSERDAEEADEAEVGR